MSNNIIYLCATGVSGEINALQSAVFNNFPNEEAQIITVKNEVFESELADAAVNVTGLEIKNLDYPDPNVIARSFYEYFKGVANPLILMDANRYNNGIAARLAAALSANIVTDVDSAINGTNNLKVLKKAYSGALKRIAEIPLDKATILTFNNSVNDGEYKPDKQVDVQTKVVTNDFKIPANAKFSVLKSDSRLGLADAEIVIAGGRGLKDADGFKELYRLAENIDAAVGASRPAVDSGWVDNSLMIGQSGKTIAPNVYFTFGISGTIQHMTGVEKAKCIIAINNDKNAQIFKMADYGIIGDAKVVIQELIQKTDK